MMIEGFATPEGTAALSDITPGFQYTSLGSTGLRVSRAGFGCYRVSIGVKPHERSLEKALCRGINLIDTSTNYADGGSESMVGKVLKKLILGGDLKREQVVVVSKAGYLQGKNYEMAQERKEKGRPFKEVVLYGKEIEHCIHPEFLKVQLDMSLERLGLDTLDLLLLHNPEYYLDWAHKNKVPLFEARSEYDQRIKKAFQYLEEEVASGRIRGYGVSSNTFPFNADHPEFTSLETMVEMAESISKDHHFKVIQMPLNLFETGAVLDKNQSDGTSVLAYASQKNLGVLINRPLNAFYRNKLIRLADIKVKNRMDYKEIIHRIKALTRSETKLWKTLFNEIETIPKGLKVRLKQQLCIGETLKHYWRSFGSYEKWRQAEAGIFLPRIYGVMDFLEQHKDGHEKLAEWHKAHARHVEKAFDAVASIYAEDAVLQNRRIRQMVNAADSDWNSPVNLSRLAIRTILSTRGVSSVLVGMRNEKYVLDIVKELSNHCKVAERDESWRQLKKNAEQMIGS